MSYKSDKAAKQVKERHQVILNDLLREEANRYCADCEAKGPRWASWNLGVFLCIRCAGIHRNLGVHISRVKSVNLDSWTAAQIESIQEWGNKRAKEFYECYLPTDFVRPQGDSAMETLIRNKYERKLYIRKGGEPPQNKIRESDQSKPKGKDKQREIQPAKLTATAATSDKKAQPKAAQNQPNKMVVSRPHVKNVAEIKPEEPKIVDLLGMDTNPSIDSPLSSNAVQDEFSLFMSSNDNVNNQMPQTQQIISTSVQQQQQAQSSNQIENGNSLLLEEKTTSKPNTKESILSLYQSGNQQQKQVFGVPGGVYMPQQQPQNTGIQGSNQSMMGSNQQHLLMNQQMQVNPNHMGMNQLQFGGSVNQQQNMMRQNAMGFNQHNFANQMNVKMVNSNQMQPHQQMMSNMMSMQNQMQNMNMGAANQSRNQFYPSQMMQNSTMPGNLGQNIIANSYGPNRPMMPSQQPILVNGPSIGMGFANSNMGLSANMGNTLNNQLWK